MPPQPSPLPADNFFRYLKLWLDLARNSLLRQLEFKIDFAGRLSIELVWIGTQLIFFKSTFQFLQSLAGWSVSEIWFFVGSLIFVDGLMMGFFHDNQNRFGQVIRLGLLDFYLLYPVSSRFLANLRFVNVISLINMFIACGILGWASHLPGLHLDFTAWLLWFVYMILGAVLIGSLGIIIASLAFWTTQTSNLMWLFYELYRLGHRPESLYAPWLRRLLIGVFPAAFFISIPVQIALGKVHGIAWYLAPFLWTAAALWASRWVWKLGLKRYESAMS